MDAGNVSAIISAVAGISGVLLGNSFVAIKEYLGSRTKRKKDTAYLGIIVVSHLERFANGCLHVACDDGTEYGRPAGNNGEENVPTTIHPEFQPLDISVDWKLLPKDLIYSILWLPDKQEQLHSRLAGIEEYSYDPPEHTEYFWVRRRGYAELGLQASDLARRLRMHAGIPLEEHLPDEWNRDQHMKDVIKNIDAKREAHERRRSENPIQLQF
ncbi:hypothetical protein HK44_016460 [Pseudomonas fluorescens HK44]|uniref:Uncharacterized protein n=1 Tax=Pseudomonas fluorescens HK44 TaxID=1042209 RepID=A0A010THK2_PSEFL|nr:hypothetical protein [Pseudomonas fluorescens]EXF96527.1 hypothetical protein HK44_016460 [Pseudomonas fluorescens HK44]